jgi:hypothetical protein
MNIRSRAIKPSKSAILKPEHSEGFAKWEKWSEIPSSRASNCGPDRRKQLYPLQNRVDQRTNHRHSQMLPNLAENGHRLPFVLGWSSSTCRFMMVQRSLIGFTSAKQAGHSRLFRCWASIESTVGGGWQKVAWSKSEDDRVSTTRDSRWKSAKVASGLSEWIGACRQCLRMSHSRSGRHLSLWAEIECRSTPFWMVSDKKWMGRRPQTRRVISVPLPNQEKKGRQTGGENAEMNSFFDAIGNGAARE